MSLRPYSAKRNFKKTPEPKPKKRKRKESELCFVVHKHAARHLHYDFRLEVSGVLKSWAIPKGPSMNPKEMRLAILTDDHPYDYKDFEGIIPEGYGKGIVLIWDQGTYHIKDKNVKETQKEMVEGLAKGKITFMVEGEKLRGTFTLARMKRGENQWLLIKNKDDFVLDKDILKLDRSVVSDMTLEELAKESP